MHFILAVATFGFFHTSSVLSSPRPINHLLARQSNTNPYDLSWIQKWAAVGDSYAAGIGAGERIDYWCSRYDHSYPSMINANYRMSGSQSFEFKACSGDKSPDVGKQVDSLSDSYNAITVSSGGNDVGLVALLNECIFTWNPRYGCPATIADSKQKIEGVLSDNLNSLYAKVRGKLATNGFAYVTAYARFFDDTSTDCDSVSLHWYPWPIGVLNYQYLTVQRRKDMNELVDLVNAKIRDAVKNAGSQFIMVEYDSYFGLLQGRYCLPGVQEPSPNRDNLLFYLDGTNEAAAKKKRQTVGLNDFPNTTFEGQVAAMIEAGRQNLTETETNPNIVSLLTLPVPDSWAQVFHPLQMGHSLIASKVLYHMSASGSQSIGKNPGPELEVIANNCPHKSKPAPIAANYQPGCGAELGLNFPSEFQLIDKKAPVSELLYRMRDQACQGLCEKVAGVPDNLLAAERQGENGCEYAVKISAGKEAYFYATGSGQNCYDATEKMINVCMTYTDDGKPIHEAGWINGPNYGEFYQVGVRDLNGEGSHHPALTTVSTDHLGHLHIACHRIGYIFSHGYHVDISGWDDGNWGKSIDEQVKKCNLVVTSWQYEPGTDYVFTDGTHEEHWAAFTLPLSNGGCAESQIEKALGLRGGGLNCPFGAAEELDLFK